MHNEMLPTLTRGIPLEHSMVVLVILTAAVATAVESKQED